MVVSSEADSKLIDHSSSTGASAFSLSIKKFIIHLDFIITPQSVNVTEGSTASFYCRFGAPLRTTWHINGTPWHQLYLANQTIFRAGNYLNQGNRVFNLSMTALPSNNHSVILCIVNYTIYSEPAILLIQGEV